MGIGQLVRSNEVSRLSLFESRCLVWIDNQVNALNTGVQIGHTYVNCVSEEGKNSFSYSLRSEEGKRHSDLLSSISNSIKTERFVQVNLRNSIKDTTVAFCLIGDTSRKLDRAISM